jgi:hypothetical protein
MAGELAKTSPLAVGASVPVRDSYRATGELSRGDELLNGFPDRSRWVELLQEKSLQGRQNF